MLYTYVCIKSLIVSDCGSKGKKKKKKKKKIQCSCVCDAHIHTSLSPRKQRRVFRPNERTIWEPRRFRFPLICSARSIRDPSNRIPFIRRFSLNRVARSSSKDKSRWDVPRLRAVLSLFLIVIPLTNSLEQPIVRRVLPVVYVTSFRCIVSIVFSFISVRVDRPHYRLFLPPSVLSFVASTLRSRWYTQCRRFVTGIDVNFMRLMKRGASEKNVARVPKSFGHKTEEDQRVRREFLE